MNMATTKKQANGLVGSDERLVKSRGSRVRGDRGEADDSRTQQDGTAFSDLERRSALRSEWIQEVLPTPPKLEGFHTCWLSSTNSTDPIYKRLRIGYIIVKAHEVPALKNFAASSGEYDGCVTINEMVLAKIPQQLYEDLMLIYHHDMPLEEEGSLREQLIKQGEDGKDSHGNRLGTIEGEGFNKLGQRPAKLPTFS
jgi:hypothetical protein